MPSPRASNAARRCSGSICAWPRSVARLAAAHGLLGLDGQFVEAKCHGVVSGPLSRRDEG